MANPRFITISLRERPWAHSNAEKSWQRFWGVFELHAATGLYVEKGSDPEHLKSLATAFKKLPQTLRDLAQEWRVTFNFATVTASGNASTFYGDFRRTNKADVSPHIEMGPRSLRPSHILAHLCHELCHLYWRSRSQSERDLYRQFLTETCRKGTIEVTEYVQEYFSMYWKRASGDHNARTWAKEAVDERWFEESFCDTVAALVDNDYPSVDPKRTIHLPTRRIVIASTFSLQLPTPTRSE